MSKRKYPISIRDTPPGEGAVKIAQNRVDGISEGFHTGGAWLYRGRVWKPLDGRPYANADFHIETEEEKCLTALQGKPLFPKNWEVKESNGRRFIVRDKVSTFPNGGLSLSLEQLYYIEDGLNLMNSLKWEVNDDIVIGKDRSGKLFIVDLSAANYTTGSYAYGADDYTYFNKLCVQAGFPEIPTLRSAAVEINVQLIFSSKFKTLSGARIPINYIYSHTHNVNVRDSVDLTELVQKLPSKENQVASKFHWLGTSEKIDGNILRQSDLRLRYSKKSR
jgi:hypothetical protein